MFSRFSPLLLNLFCEKCHKDAVVASFIKCFDVYCLFL